MPEDDGALQVMLGGVLGCRVFPLGSARGRFHNRHFRAEAPTGRPVFVKLFDDRGYWRRAVAADALARDVLRTPRVLEYGELAAQQRWWVAYDWVDLDPQARLTPALVAQVGEMVGQLHTLPVPAGLTRHDVDAEILARADALEPADPGAADRIRALRARWGPAAIEGESVIHGDLHRGNIGVSHAGEPIVFDLENVRRAHPLLDFAKLADLDQLADPGERDAFHRGYQRHATPVWPWPVEAMRVIRLWATAGVLVYSHARRLPNFAGHGYRRLAELEGL
ncbi:aminoglycoside phosphotransferase family protein [Amycolatopsis minnesotensis]|uniref:Aminoglycoside phosphotransferase domain-containing protein n=1 Tax=Amycolatopsis minnesotensis TaxID=337894 RepID=A0ABN2SBM0_9PSEU